MRDENVRDQGSGLRQLIPGRVLRLGGLVAQGDQETELPLLLRLCDILHDMGHDIAVLDATTAESAAAPGLSGLLDGSFDARDLAAAQEFPAGLTVLPAAAGMNALRSGDNTALVRLSRACRAYDMVLIFGSAPLFAALAPHCLIRPALGCAPDPNGVLTTYKSLRTLVAVNIVPAVATVVTRPGMATAAGALAARENLRQCVLDRLGRQIDVLRIRVVADGGAPDAEASRLALRLFEGAATLAEPMQTHTPIGAMAQSVAAAAPARSDAQIPIRSH
jgi:hypothetical protein